MAAEPAGDEPVSDKEVSDVVAGSLILEDTDKTPSQADGDQPVAPPSWNDDEPESAISAEAATIWTQSGGS